MKHRVRLAELLISCGRLARIAWIYLLLLAGLRALWLFRPDPFGHAILVEPERHLLQALAGDALQAAVLAVPALLLVALAAGRPRVARVASWLYLALLALAIFLSILDEETIRFAGVHLSLAHLRTYGNGAAVSEMPKTLAYDEGGPFLGVLLVVASLPASWWLMRKALRRQATPRTALLAAGFCAAAAASYVYLFVLPPPSLVAWRLAT